jgi:hypothetical protein
LRLADDIVETDRIPFPCPSYSYDAVVLVLRPPAISDVDSIMACLHEALAKAGRHMPNTENTSSTDTSRRRGVSAQSAAADAFAI